MSQNMSNTDRIIRVCVALFFIIVPFTGVSAFELTSIKVVSVLVGALNLFSAFRGFCPLYTMVGFSTRRDNRG